MGRIIGEHYEGDVKVTYVDEGDGINIRYSQDVTPVLDNIASINADGGARMNDGIGRLKYDFPISLLMKHATQRGISWEKLAYSTEYDSEWKVMGEKWSKLTPEQKRTYY